ncbi:cation-transporting ATPase 13A3/4/5 [Cryptococcus deuterogattii 99/473]|uniref:Cation-transporting ATPase n=1 Tax=Cryptococcus deuterogattii Ram5 TaxID=1296110 RepID=A0A0D0T9X2_9TREE|nr:cation-transporting ATPase 13A3/4/5 [Cryptococcus deuterogattii Ram5]KIY59518.1 cation-transporting ATPase 13A3/4/5 [Cryptococcus deuterogattii 99/473]
MTSPPTPPPLPDNIPSAISVSRPTAFDAQRALHTSDQETSTIPPPQNTHEDGHEPPGPSDYDYTENAPQAVVDAVAIERAKREQEGPPEMMVGSWTSWAGSDNADTGIFPSSITRSHMRVGSRRTSIASRHSVASIARPSSVFRHRGSSQIDLVQSPGSAVFALDGAEDESTAEHGAYRRHMPSRRDSRRWGRRDSNAQPGSYFSYRDYDRDQEDEDHISDEEEEFERQAVSPQKPSTTALGRIASFIGLTRHDAEDEEAAMGHPGDEHRRRSSSRSRSRRASSESRSYARSPSPSPSEQGWGYEDDDYMDSYGEGDEGYSSSLADDTSLPPQSRPTSPSIPLVPSATDGIFGEPNARPIDQDEPRDFVSVAVPSRQTIVLPDEDLSIRFTCYRTDPFRNVLWWLGCILTLGALGLLGRWMPTIWVKFLGRETSFEEAKEGSWLVVETPYGNLHIIPLHIVPYPYPLSTVFPQSIPPASANSANGSVSLTSSSAPAKPLHSLNGEPAGGVGGAKDLMSDVEPGKTVWEETTGLLKVMEYRYTKFALDPTTGRWAMIRDWRDPKWTSNRAVAQGLDSAVRKQRLVLMGDNIIDIASKSVAGLLVDEVLHPFYVFQIASIILWSLDDYYYYAFAIALISITSIMSTLIETKRTIERMREMSRFHCNVKVLIDGEWVMKDCSELVPGDIFDSSDPNLTVFPCDALLLSGDAIVNESMLTGESVPVSKIPAKDETLRALSRESKQGSSEIDSDLAKHYLFSGTKIIRVRAGAKPAWAPKSESSIALAMVTRTGFNTTKGALVRSMLFPKPMGFKFYRDSMNFIGVLAIIAGFGFAVSAIQFIRIGIHWHTIMLRALDLITIVVPPALPATLTIGTTFAIERLRKSGIFCISPNRVNIGGKINVVCFDKTGTLTEDGLDVLGVRTIDRQNNRFSELHSDIVDVPIEGGINGKTPLLYALATCHALKLIESEIIGDPLDIKMFEYTGWTLDEGQSRPVTKGNAEGARPQALVQTVVRPPGTDRWRMEDALKQGSKHAHFLELGVIRTFDFVSALRRMSVIVKRLKSTCMEVYVKGAPEVMPDICDPSSFPHDYDDMLSYYTRNGFRVIAIAGKSIEGLTWLRAQRMRRDVAESDLQFLGFIVFENKLKPGTAPNIHTLRAAHLACRMVTGDNVRTAISVARECGLVSHSASVYIPTFIPGTGVHHEARLDWSSVDDDRLKLDDWTLKPLTNQVGVAMDTAEAEMHDYQLALTGDVFRWMLEYAEFETMERMLVKGVIFARMSPDEKAELVERLQYLGYTVAFCGDGANDCGALKAADVGVSLSEAEASVAAPFTSQIPDISCMVEIIKEGRAALVTSFSCFKYMALYSMIQFMTVTLLYSFASSLGDFQFLYIDLFIIIPIAVTMGRTLPYPKIHPKRPTASLVSRKVLISIIGQILINAAIQVFVFVWVRKQSWYTKPDTNVDKLETFNFENSALFLVSCFQYILVAGVFSVGPPYRKPLYTNPSLVICLVGLTSFSTYILLSPAKSIALILDIINFNFAFKLQLLAIAAVNILASFAFEKFAERPISRLIVFAKRWKGRRGKRRDYRSLPSTGN